MQLGIFAKTFVRPTLSETLDAVKAHGLTCVQFNLACAGSPTMPDAIEPELCSQIRQAMAARGISMAAISGTFNMIHPDPTQRQVGLRQLGVLASACRQLGATCITLCSGTRDPGDMWRYHPDNASPAAWQDLRASLAEALRLAEAYDVTLAIEPEVSNVVASARLARQLLDEMQSPRLKVIMDAANLFPAGQLARMTEVLDEAFELLGQEISIAHAKDLSRDGAAGQEAAGTGLLDYDYYLSSLRRVGFAGPLILHSLSEAQVVGCVAFLREKLTGKSLL